MPVYGPPNYQVEADFYHSGKTSFPFFVPSQASPFSIIEHPFRIIVHDEECEVLGVGTATFGPAGDVDKYAMEFITSFPTWMNALIYNRCDLAIRRVIARSLTDASPSPT